ncbi:hypothetical protein Acr_01g0013710 [Actinidia rufa]|uniref:Retrotransposon gag domain-containing protein n=1 Tax=Actinidia rufa TaxID=165716 RepID=A0A7J0E5M2_9ERIC|nr:hypothetical protein Acr_01g0013710 [Actinidia rufa]
MVETWGILKKELKDQFLPCNSSWVARELLRGLRHTGSVRDYVKEFSSLLLDIMDMSEEDKIFNFMAGLQNWAQLELRRLGVKNMSSAIAVADGLLDYNLGNPSTSEFTENKSGGKMFEIQTKGK